MPPKKKPKHDPNQTTLNLAGGALGVRRDVVAGEPQQRRITGFVPRNPPPPIQPRPKKSPPARRGYKPIKIIQVGPMLGPPQLKPNTIKKKKKLTTKRWRFSNVLAI